MSIHIVTLIDNGPENVEDEENCRNLLRDNIYFNNGVKSIVSKAHTLVTTDSFGLMEFSSSKFKNAVKSVKSFKNNNIFVTSFFSVMEDGKIFHISTEKCKKKGNGSYYST